MNTAVVTGIVLKVPSADVYQMVEAKLAKLGDRLARMQVLLDKAKALDTAAKAENASLEDEDNVAVAVTMSTKVTNLTRTVAAIRRDIEFLTLVKRYCAQRDYYWLNEHEMRELGFAPEA